MTVLRGRIINEGYAEGYALVSPEPIGFYGGVDMKTGNIIERGHPLEGKCIKDEILVFELIKGSTVTPYVIQGLEKYEMEPKAIICNYSEVLLTQGVILADIPCIDQIDISKIKNNDYLEVYADEGYLKIISSHKEQKE